MVLLLYHPCSDLLGGCDYGLDELGPVGLPGETSSLQGPLGRRVFLLIGQSSLRAFHLLTAARNVSEACLG